jgi:hypothetical protein
MTCYAGETVLVCSNNTITGLSPKTERVKHLKNGETKLVSSIDASLERFEEFKQNRFNEIETMKNVAITDQQLSELVLDMLRTNEFYPQFVGEVVGEWDCPNHNEFKPRTLWSFHNCYTELSKRFNFISKLKTDNSMRQIISQRFGI